MVILIGNCNRYQTNHMNILKNIKNSYFYSNTFLKSIIANILLSLPLKIARLFVLTIWKDESSNKNNTTPSKIHFYKNNLYFSLNFCSQKFHKVFKFLFYSTSQWMSTIYVCVAKAFDLLLIRNFWNSISLNVCNR